MATGAPRHTPLPAEQATLISARSQELLPSVGDLTSRLATADAQGRKLIVKFGIDPTAADVHVGHAVPMIIASRFQRMGHQVVFIVGDTATTANGSRPSPCRSSSACWRSSRSPHPCSARTSAVGSPQGAG